MWSRANSVMAGILAALVTAMFIVVTSGSSSAPSGIIVPSAEVLETPAKPVEIGVTQSSTATATVLSTRQSSSAAASRPAPKPTVRTTTATPRPETVVVPEAPPAAKRFDQSAYYRIVNVANSLSLDSAWNTSMGSALRLWAPDPGPNLQFRVVETGDGYYRLINRASGRLVDGRGATSAGTWVGQWDWSPSPNVQWQVIERGDGMFTVKNRATGLVLDGGGAGVRPGAQAKQWPDDSSRNLLWRFVAA